MVVCYFGREVCFDCNSHSVRPSKQYFQWAVPRFSVCGIWGEKQKIQNGKFWKEWDCRVCTQVAAVVCWTRSATQPFLQHVCGIRVSLWGQTESFHSRWITAWNLWKLQETLCEQHRNLCAEDSVAVSEKNQTGRILSSFPYCFNWMDYSISSILTLYCWSGNLRVSWHFLSYPWCV